MEEMKCCQYETQLEEDHEMYKATCDCCGIRLSIDVPMMCYERKKKEKKFCNDCYWGEGYWNNDLNSDNEDEIDDFKSENIFDTLCGNGHLNGAWGCDFCGKEGANNLKEFLEENDMKYYNAVYHYNINTNSWNEKIKKKKEKAKLKRLKRRRLVIIDAPKEEEVDICGVCDSCHIHLNKDVDVMCWNRKNRSSMSWGGEKKTLCNRCYFGDDYKD